MLQGRLLWASSSRCRSGLWLCMLGFHASKHSICDHFCALILCWGQQRVFKGGVEEGFCFLLSVPAALQDKADVVADIAQSLVEIQEADVVVQLGNALVVSGHISEATQLASTPIWWPCYSSNKQDCCTCIH